MLVSNSSTGILVLRKMEKKKKMERRRVKSVPKLKTEFIYFLIIK